MNIRLTMASVALAASIYLIGPMQAQTVDEASPDRQRSEGLSGQRNSRERSEEIPAGDAPADNPGQRQRGAVGGLDGWEGTGSEPGNSSDPPVETDKH